MTRLISDQDLSLIAVSAVDNWHQPTGAPRIDSRSPVGNSVQNLVETSGDPGMNTERFQSRQAKAIAGAVAGFSAALVNCAIGGCEIVSLINAGVELLQVAIATAAGYLIVYWAPKNLDPPPRQQKR